MRPHPRRNHDPPWQQAGETIYETTSRPVVNRACSPGSVPGRASNDDRDDWPGLPRAATTAHDRPVADLTGFAALVEAVAPEVVYQRVRPVIDELITLAELHGGHVQQVLGDGCMAVFAASADDTTGRQTKTVTRAVQAGVAMIAAREQPRARLPLHVGIECGEVLLSQSWKPARFALWRRAATTAARLCDLASP